MKVDIIGTSFTASIYDWSRKTEKWSVGSAFPLWGDRVDLYFCLHPGEDIDFKNVVNQDNYPLEDIIRDTGSQYFTNSIAYMMALAYYRGATEINIFGVDIESDTEYKFERPCVAYWTGYLKAQGVKMNHNSNLTEPVFKYGFEQENMVRFLRQLQERADAYEDMARKEINPDIKNQWIGAMTATKKIINLVKG